MLIGPFPLGTPVGARGVDDARRYRRHRRRADRVAGRHTDAQRGADVGCSGSYVPASGTCDVRAAAPSAVTRPPLVRERDRLRAGPEARGSAVCVAPSVGVAGDGRRSTRRGPGRSLDDPVGFDAAESEPSAFVAVTRTRMRIPTSMSRSRYVVPVAPPIVRQLEPSRPHRRSGSAASGTRTTSASSRTTSPPFAVSVRPRPAVRRCSARPCCSVVRAPPPNRSPAGAPLSVQPRRRQARRHAEAVALPVAAFSFLVDA